MEKSKCPVSHPIFCPSIRKCVMSARHCHDKMLPDNYFVDPATPARQSVSRKRSVSRIEKQQEPYLCRSSKN